MVTVGGYRCTPFLFLVVSFDIWFLLLVNVFVCVPSFAVLGKFIGPGWFPVSVSGQMALL